MRSQQGRPSAEAEKRAGMCLEAERGNWEKVLELTFREFEDFTSIYETRGDHRDRRLDKYRYTYWYYFKFAKLVTNEKK